MKEKSPFISRMKKHSITSNPFWNLIKRKIPFSLLFPVLLLQSSISSFSQPLNSNSDTTKKTFVHSPGMAMVFSAVIPGLGQAYNKKYWKIPIVYAAMGTTIYFINYNNKLYKEYRQAYIYRTDDDSTTFDKYPDVSDENLKVYQDDYRRFRDLNVILTALFYTLNIVDAYVDAQLVSFDVSDNLSLRVSPVLNFYSSNQKPGAGLTFSLTF